jgi:hypothetical protein
MTGCKLCEIFKQDFCPMLNGNSEKCIELAEKLMSGKITYEKFEKEMRKLHPNIDKLIAEFKSSHSL